MTIVCPLCSVTSSGPFSPATKRSPLVGLPPLANRADSPSALKSTRFELSSSHSALSSLITAIWDSNAVVTLSTAPPASSEPSSSLKDLINASALSLPTVSVSIPIPRPCAKYSPISIATLEGECDCITVLNTLINSDARFSVMTSMSSRPIPRPSRKAFPVSVPPSFSSFSVSLYRSQKRNLENALPTAPCSFRELSCIFSMVFKGSPDSFAISLLKSFEKKSSAVMP